MIRKTILSASFALLAASAAFTAVPAKAATDAAAVVKHYADVAHAKYEDSLITAKALDKAIDALIATPSEETLKAAREAWIKARVPYQQSEVYRFGNPIVDDWEGKVNAWPLYALARDTRSYTHAPLSCPSCHSGTQRRFPRARPGAGHSARLSR